MTTLFRLIIILTIFSQSISGRELLPNIVIMMADDMGIGDTSVYLGQKLGPNHKPISKTLRTPNLESFAKDGMVFTNAYAPASMCSSTRYSLLTGRYSHRAYLKKQGWLPHGPNTPMIQRAISTLPEMLQTNGYFTGAIGKYHVGMAFADSHGGVADEFDYNDVDFSLPILDGPTHHGFNEFFGVPGNTEDPLDTEPRIYIRNERWTFTNRAEMQRIGMKKLNGRILAAPDWNLANLGPDFLRQALDFIDRRATEDSAFFLYYAPCANHYQRNPDGDYAIPDLIEGIPVKGQSRYTDEAPGGDREDMIIENDIAFGKLIEKLRETDDPRAPGNKLIDNTLVIFTSDNGPNVGNNLEPNQESGGLRGKKAKLWEGGIRVPFVASLPGSFEAGKINNNVFSLTDLYATLAGLIGHKLESNQALDSLNSMPYWSGKETQPDERARIFFCHLGPPYLNDSLAIRRGSQKLIVKGGFAMPWINGGSLGHLEPSVYYDLNKNPYETGDELSSAEASAQVVDLGKQLLEIHNRGHGRDLELTDAPNSLVIDEGWYSPRNDITGEIGFEFSLTKDVDSMQVTQLGMWDSQHKDRPVRQARAVPDEFGRDQPGKKGSRNLNNSHVVRLLTLTPEKPPKQLVQVTLAAPNGGKLIGSFRYIPLSEPVVLEKGKRYLLLQSTVAGDGDHFRDFAPFDGLPPLSHPDIKILRSVLVRDGNFDERVAIPAFSDMHSDYSKFRFPVGPNLLFQ